jgi:exopolysaccharide biosynthesis polyprenyl glycosylphosphotransferase
MSRGYGTEGFQGSIVLGGKPDTLSRAQKRVHLAVAQIPIDLVALTGGYWSASGIVAKPSHSYFLLALLTALIILYGVSAVVVRAYSADSFLSRSKSIIRALGALALSTTLFTFLLFLLKGQMNVSRAEFLAGTLLAAVLLVGLRYLYVTYTLHALRGSLYTTTILVDRTNGNSRSLRTPQPGTTIIDITGKFDPPSAGPDDYDALARMIGQSDRVVVSCADDRRMHWAYALQGMNVHAEALAPELRSIGALGIGRHAGQTTLILAKGPLGLRARVAKRLFDLTFSAAALVVLSFLLLITAIAIKLDSKGPVFFRQPRIGRQNRVFHVLKFRSMHVNQLDTGGRTSTKRGDPRITRVGRFIRASSIDELPQLFNVLFGDMSVVGPRPHAVYSTAEHKLFWEIDSRYWHRHACKPGITGLAQVKGLRGATELTSDLTNRVSADLDYIGNWSFVGDLVIILRTFAVIFHRNAY